MLGPFPQGQEGEGDGEPVLEGPLTKGQFTPISRLPWGNVLRGSEEETLRASLKGIAGGTSAASLGGRQTPAQAFV